MQFNEIRQQGAAALFSVNRLDDNALQWASFDQIPDQESDFSMPLRGFPFMKKGFEFCDDSSIVPFPSNFIQFDDESQQKLMTPEVQRGHLFFDIPA